MTRLNTALVLSLAAAGACLPLCAAKAVETPTVFKLLSKDIVVATDGTFVETSRVEMVAKNDLAAHQIAQAEIPYRAATEDLDIVEAYTLKADGTRLPVAAGAIYDQTPRDAKSVPIDDRKQKLIVFPNVTAGDTVVYTAQTHVRRSFFPGYFAIADSMPRTISIEQARATIVAPKGIPLAVETHGLGFTKEEGDGTVTYRWTYRQPDALIENNAQLAALDLDPRYFASSFKDYEEVARVYNSITAPLTKVTPKIQARADEITAGTTDRRQQAEKIYYWVSEHINYVGIDLGVAAIAPRSAETVLAGGYGDSKDHAAIFVSLLEAMGIDSEIVLINNRNGYSLAEAPAIPGQFNHAIVWLPEFKVYADTSIGVAPFGVLAPEEYGKPALHAVATGTALRRTPVLTADAVSISLQTNAKLDADGTITGETKTVATGPAAISLRLIGLDIERRGAESAAAARLQTLRYPGATGTFELEPPAAPGPAYTVVGRFEMQPQPQFLAGVPMPMPGGLRLLEPTGSWLLGPVWHYKLTADDATPCYSGHMEEELRLELPVGKHPVKLPTDTKIAENHVEFTANWSVAGQTVILKRDFKVSLDQPLCDGETRKEAAKVLAAIRDSFATSELSLAD